eukprot:CAMPEP_0178980024 /NCGR_PEP_ID=MMETSP0789-20121207/26237_1 /TAXON_ID=3005 /ORGANISM="Rhizosolenia setigera, Strain CCMP 1694" /LENGTH=793 /DNA_ID=CAMNT_0020670333 /DNA_START=181 /DNA_END=2560 /DNA_ORIENTATION=-
MSKKHDEDDRKKSGEHSGNEAESRGENLEDQEELKQNNKELIQTECENAPIESHDTQKKGDGGEEKNQDDQAAKNIHGSDSDTASVVASMTSPTKILQSDEEKDSSQYASMQPTSDIKMADSVAVGSASSTVTSNLKTSTTIQRNELSSNENNGEDNCQDSIVSKKLKISPSISVLQTKSHNVTEADSKTSISSTTSTSVDTNTPRRPFSFSTSYLYNGDNGNNRNDNRPSAYDRNYGYGFNNHSSDDTSSNRKSSLTTSSSNRRGWTNVRVETSRSDPPPCQRSLHSAAVYDGAIYVFGGYDGQTRVNDFHSFSFVEKRWSQINPSPSSGAPPSPRDRHVSVVHGHCFYVFGGFDGSIRVQDFHKFDFRTNEWSRIFSLRGNSPSPRHSHSAVVHMNCMYVFGGEFNFRTSTWSVVPSAGRSPRARYRGTCVVHSHKMYLFGGHEGTTHLADTYIFDFHTRVWSYLNTQGVPPIPRDSHVAVVYRDSMYVFGGSTGSAMNDLFELNLMTNVWSPVEQQQLQNSNDYDENNVQTQPGPRFCHVGVVHDTGFYIFGGYDGSNRLNDFLKFNFESEDRSGSLSFFSSNSFSSSNDRRVPPSSLVQDLRSLVGNELMSDLTLVVEGQHIYAHKVMLVRCPYFRAMLLGEMMESNQQIIRLEGEVVRYPIFLKILEYLYTDDIQDIFSSSPVSSATLSAMDVESEHIMTTMELFVAADLFCIPRLKSLCETKMLETVTVDSAPNLLFLADQHHALSLKTKALQFILKHFESVSKTVAFENMARSNIELVLEILEIDN